MSSQVVAPDFQGTLLSDEPLSKHTYYRIGGPAFWVAQPKSVSDLQWLAKKIKDEKKPVFILGLGSNVLASDSGFSGIVIKPTKMDYSVKAIEPESSSTHVRVRAGAG
ncbi:MAG: FAD-binding protein, partial [Bdellovibrio sp.]|nr:FAD-binding protein [Bdellovibrio sp.]